MESKWEYKTSVFWVRKIYTQTLQSYWILTQRYCVGFRKEVAYFREKCVTSNEKLFKILWNRFLRFSSYTYTGKSDTPGFFWVFLHGLLRLVWFTFVRTKSVISIVDCIMYENWVFCLEAKRTWMKLKMIVSFLELWDSRRTRDPGEAIAPLVLTMSYLSPFRSR